MSIGTASDHAGRRPWPAPTNWRRQTPIRQPTLEESPAAASVPVQPGRPWSRRPRRPICRVLRRFGATPAGGRPGALAASDRGLRPLLRSVPAGCQSLRDSQPSEGENDPNPTRAHERLATSISIILGGKRSHRPTSTSNQWALRRPTSLRPGPVDPDTCASPLAVCVNPDRGTHRIRVHHVACPSGPRIGEESPGLGNYPPVGIQQMGPSARGLPRQSWPPVMVPSIRRPQLHPHRSRAVVDRQADEWRRTQLCARGSP